MQSVKDTAQQAAEAVKEGAQRVVAALGSGGGGADDEPDALLCSDTPPIITPSHLSKQAAAREQIDTDTPPPQEPDRDLGHTGWRKATGPLEKMKDSAAHAVEGVKLRLHLGEAMHMAKAAEGRNQAQDDPIDHALHDALKPEPGERPETSAFPETLGDALVVAQMRDLPKDPPSATVSATGEAGSDGVEPTPPNPFSAGARSKL